MDSSRSQYLVIFKEGKWQLKAAHGLWDTGCSNVHCGKIHLRGYLFFFYVSEYLQGIGQEEVLQGSSIYSKKEPLFLLVYPSAFWRLLCPTFIHMILSLIQTVPCLLTRVKSTIRPHVLINAAIIWNCACVFVYFPWVPLSLLQVPWWPRLGLFCWSLVFKGKNFLPSR